MLAALLAALVPGLFLYGALLPLLSGTLLAYLNLNVALAALAACTVIYYTASALLYLVDEGHEALAVVAYGAVISGCVFALSFASLGLYAFAASVLAFLLSVSYVVPAFVAILQGGFVERVIKDWGKLIELTYYESDLTYRRFYHHLMNLFLGGSLGYVVASVLLKMTVNPFVGLPLAILVALFSYSKASEDLLESDSGNALIGMGLALLSAYCLSGLALPSVGLVLVVISGTALNSFLLFPLVYKACKVCLGGSVEVLGNNLKGLHSRSVKVLDSCYSALRRVQREAFDDPSDFSPLLGHGLNFAFAAWSTWQLSSVVFGDLASAGPLSYAALVLVGLNLFVLTDRIVSHCGAEVLALSAGGAAAFATWQAALASTGSGLSALIVSVFAFLLASAVLAPLAYLGLRYLAKGAITPWLAPVVSGFADLVWRSYKSIWRFLLDALAGFVDFLEPVLSLAARVLNFAVTTAGRAFRAALKVVSSLLRPLGQACVSAWRSARAIIDRLSGKN